MTTSYVKEIQKKGGTERMSAYQDGYDKGYADGSAGNPSDRQGGPVTALLDILTSWDENLTEWEEGYDKGYEDGKEEYDSQ